MTSRNRKTATKIFFKKNFRKSTLKSRKNHQSTFSAWVAIHSLHFPFLSSSIHRSRPVLRSNHSGPICLSKSTKQDNRTATRMTPIQNLSTFLFGHHSHPSSTRGKAWKNKTPFPFSLQTNVTPLKKNVQDERYICKPNRRTEMNDAHEPAVGHDIPRKQTVLGSSFPPARYHFISIFFNLHPSYPPLLFHLFSLSSAS